MAEQFAMMEVLYTLTRLLQVFPNIISRDLLPWRENISITLRNDNGAKVAFEGV